MKLFDLNCHLPRKEEFSKMPNLEAGLAAFVAGDYTKAFELLKPIAEQGDAEAQCIVANMYQLGLGIERSKSSLIASRRFS